VEPAFDGESQIDLVMLLEMTEQEFRRRFRHRPFWRPRWSGMRRNAAIALGNRGGVAALAALRKAADDADSVVREAARWALNKASSGVANATEDLGHNFESGR
jgi:epoxyqueuosine reductase QueG